MNVPKAKYEMLQTMTDDLMKAEFVINAIGVETRYGETMDDFRSIYDILKDIVGVCSCNPTIIDDCEEFLGSKPSMQEEFDEFLSHYGVRTYRGTNPLYIKDKF